MSREPTLPDLRAAMAAHTEGAQPAPELGQAVRARVSRQRRTGTAAIAAVVLTAGIVTAASSLRPGGRSIAPSGPATTPVGSLPPVRHPTATSSPSTAATPAVPPPASTPPAGVLNYRQVCQAEGSVCSFATGSPDPLAGNVPTALLRPLHFPTLAPGQRCPATPGRRLDTAYFGGIALGSGPVQPVLAEALNQADALRGTADLLNPTSVPPWLAFNTLWVSRPAYQGPFIVRAAQRLDGPGTVMQGDGPFVTTLVVPPGPTINSSEGWRTAPGGTWVNSPGCYAWQIDGLTFSYIIVVNAILHPQKVP